LFTLLRFYKFAVVANYQLRRSTVKKKIFARVINWPLLKAVLNSILMLLPMEILQIVKNIIVPFCFLVKTGKKFHIVQKKSVYFAVFLRKKHTKAPSLALFC